MKVSTSGLRKIERALACGFKPGNGWNGPGLFLRDRRKAKKRRAPL